MSTNQYENLITLINAIRAFKETKETFYRDNEAEYYLKILEVIEFFLAVDDATIMENIDLFNRNYYLLNDFKELFLELYNDPNYQQSSAKKSNFHNSIDTLRDFTRSFNKANKSAKTATSKELKKIREKARKDLEDFQEKLETYKTTLEESKKEFHDARRSIEESNRLHASQEYWSQKKNKHRRLSLVLSGVFVFWVIILIVLTLQNITAIDAQYLGGPAQTLAENNTTIVSTLNNRHFWLHIVQSILILSLFIWIARLLLKIIFSNLHLKEEAYEKETMIVTYLALIKEGGGLSQSDRSLILEAIFRPSTNGLITDESSVTLLDVLNAFKSK